MDYMTELSTIAKAHGGIIETKIAAQRGISKAMLCKLCKENRIHRIVKGQYILPDDIQDELLAISNRSNKVIFSHETALYLHGISDRTPFEHTVTAPVSYTHLDVYKRQTVCSVPISTFVTAGSPPSRPSACPAPSVKLPTLLAAISCPA